MKPVVIDLCSGRCGWGKAFVAEGWEVMAFDLEPMIGGGEIPDGITVFREDIRKLNGYDLRAANPSLVVASPPCTEYSYMAMPFSRGKQIAAALRDQGVFPEGYTGSRTIPELTALYRACFRIARELGVPIVLENVKGAQPWVGRAKANYGSYYLWGDVARVGNRVVRDTVPVFGMPGVAAYRDRKSQNAPLDAAPSEGTGKTTWFWSNSRGESRTHHVGEKTSGHVNKRDGFSHTRHLTNQRESDAVKQAGLSGPAWFDHGAASVSSKSDSRKAASALIAEIPWELASHIARVFKPS